MGNKRDVFLNAISTGQNFGVRFDLVDGRNKQIFHCGIAENLLPFLQAAGIKFFELGNVNAVDSVSFKNTSLFAKEPQLISDEIIEKIGFKDTSPASRSSLINGAVQHCINFKNRKLLAGFVEFEQKNSYWLQNHALFSILSNYIGTKEFHSWPTDIRDNNRRSCGVISKQLFDGIIFEKTAQFLTHLSLKTLIERAKQLGIFVGATVDIMCEEFCSEVWMKQRLFFLNKFGKATVYNGLPASEYLVYGLKSSQVPYRWNEMYNDGYEIIHKLFDKQGEEFDYVHVKNGHTIFHYWEVASFEINGEHGRWVPIRSDLFFEYTKPHLDRFPYIFDFNNPLFPKHELLVRRHNLLQAIVHGEPETHIYEQYDLSMDVKILASKLCNAKIPLEGASVQKILSGAKLNLEDMLAKNFPLKLLHIDEVCRILRASMKDITRRPQYYGEIFGNILAGNPLGGNGKKLHKLGKSPFAKEKKSILKFVLSFFKGE
ncbi:MAG: 4-alpha-glucanotransferase [Puniceicoccales bacterium]|jgi:hypothetical protein|nr:4-alpha-glucanotransferase [Puniceicoccales bacterium]